MTTRREFLLTTSALALSSCIKPASISRRVQQTFNGIPTVDGAGVRLTRVIGQPALRHLDPFIMLDRFHSDDPSAYIRGFPDHPHRGFETITVMLDGRMRHKDSRGNSGLITPGGIQWMTAGRGIVHSEMPEQERGLMSGFQLWLNLPAREKMRAQEYQDMGVDRLRHVGIGNGSDAHVIAGRVLDVHGPVADRTTEPVLMRTILADDKPLSLDLPADHTAFIFVHEGTLIVDDNQRVPANTIAVLTRGDRLHLRADEMRTGFLLAAAKPIHEPIVQRGPFVMNTEAEIQKAYDDYRNGVLTL